jgi:hypothetical protein
MNHVIVAGAAVVAMIGLARVAHAQWPDHTNPGLPRLRDGKPNLTAPMPAGSKRDLSGIWLIDDLERGQKRHFFDLAVDLKPGDVTMLPWAAALQRQREDDLHKDHPWTNCIPPSPPGLSMLLHPFKIVQLPTLTLMLHEVPTGSTFRQIFMDGRTLPKDPQPNWLGYSIGKWEGQTLVVDTIGFHDKGWLDAGVGRPHTDALHLTERFHRRDVGHLDVDITIDDPKTFTKPWSTKITLQLMPDTELIEGVCENEKDAGHLVGK